jgi:hypothetical protein
MGQGWKIKGKIRYHRPFIRLTINKFVGVFPYIPESTPPDVFVITSSRGSVDIGSVDLFQVHHFTV